MNNERFAPILSAWLNGSAIAPADPRQSARAVMARLERGTSVSRSATVAAVDPASTRSVLAVMAAAAIVASFAGWLALGMPAIVPGGETTRHVGATTSDDGAIHWRSGVVDLRADGMELRVGDRTFTTEGVHVTVDAYDGNTVQWAMYPRWVEDGETLWLYLEFTSDGETWSVEPWLWLGGFIGPDGNEWGNNVDFVADDEVGERLGEPYVGDARLTGVLEMPTCELGVMRPLRASLSFEDLRLSVTPREPTFLDELADDWFHRGSMLGDLFRGELEPPSPRPLECPPDPDR